MELLLKGYPKGSDITILNCYYTYPTKLENGKWSDDFITISFRDNVTKKKHHEIIFNPKCGFYKIKDEYVEKFNQFFIDKDKVEEIIVPFRKLERGIAEATGKLDQYEKWLQEGDRTSIRKLHTDTSIMFSDMRIEDYYRFLFAQSYTNRNGGDLKLNKAYFDIEVDTRTMAGTFVDLGECPINAVTFLNEQNNLVCTFILRDPKNPLIQQFEDEYTSGRFGQKEIAEFVEGAVGGRKQLVRNKLENLKYHLKFYDDELQMIASLFYLIHKCSPDFCEGWNSSGFDLAYIIERCWNLGTDPVYILTDPRWDVATLKHYVDQRNYSDFAERGDYTVISGDVVFIDQMIQFASRRKSKIGSFKSFKLDDIGWDVAKVKKLDYSHITTNIAELPYLDFKTFILYNIMDVIVQKCIENKNQDLEYIFSKCLMNNTCYQKGHRQTVYLINRFTDQFFKKGYVIGNNVNRWNEEPDKFAGAFVANPTRTSNYSKIVIDGRPIMVCNNLQDYDYKSLYPSIMGEFNIAPNTQIGRIDIPNRVYAHENAYLQDKYSRSGEFIENLVTDNIIEFSHRWLHLANFQQCLMDMNEYYMTRSMFGPRYQIYENLSRGILNPIYDAQPGPFCPIRFGEAWPKPPVYFYSTLEQNGMSTSNKDYQKEAGTLK